MPTLTAGLMSFVDVERVEVLKGPQGTLFGRNATAGVIQIITRDPKDSLEADLKAGWGNYDTYEAGVYLAGGLAPGVRASISGYSTRQSDGWGTNLTTGNDVFKGYERSLRTKWIIDAGDNTEIRIGADYAKSRPNTPPAYRPLPGRILTTGTPFFGPGATYHGFYNVSENRDVSVTTEQWGANLQIRHGFEVFELVSITSYRQAKTVWVFDQDGTPVNAVSVDSREPATTWTQELQLQSTNRGAFQWIVGAYYFNNQAKYDPLRLYGTNPPFNLFTIDRFVSTGGKSLAGFAQGTYDFGQGTKLTLGLRYTHDKRTISGFDLRNGELFAPSVLSQNASFDKLTWRASLDHRFDDQILAYATVSRGYKSGVFSSVAYTDPAVRPETLDTYEIGFKSDLLDRRLRLNGAAFYNIFKDVQVQFQKVGGIGLNNAAKARSYGFELEMEARPADALDLRAAMTVLDGKYQSYPVASFYSRNATQTTGVFNGDATGLDTHYTPPFTASFTANYRIGDFALTGSIAHNSGFYLDVQNAIKQPSYDLVNASIAYTSPNGVWGARIWGRNLTQERYYTAIVPQSYGDTATPAAPRTYGVTLEVHLR